jgi:DNA-binding NarL/FixJ family response regulator
MKPYRFLLIDDDLFYCKSLEKYFEANDLINIIGYFTQSDSITKQTLQNLNFNCILLDMNMPSKNGIQMMQSFLEWNIEIPVFVCTSFLNKEYTEQFHQMGVKHCIKKEMPNKLEETLLAILLPAAINEDKNLNSKTLEINSQIISLKEQYLIILICEEKNLKAIADQLNLSAEAIKKQKSQLAKKLGIPNTTTSFYKFTKLINLLVKVE